VIPLARRPSLWAGFLGRLAFGTVWTGAMFGATWFVWTRGENTPAFAWVILGILDLFALIILLDVAFRFWNALNGRQPIIEISRQSLRYGDEAQLRVVEPHPQAVKEIVVRLIADHWVTKKDSDGSTLNTIENCWDQELLRMNLAEGTEFSRMLHLKLPESVPAEKPRWKIIVTTSLRQGGVIDHAFPFTVEKRAV
jgi:hypothetical protein